MNRRNENEEEHMAIVEATTNEQTQDRETARQHLADLLTSGFDKDARFIEAEARFTSLLEQIGPEAQTELEEAAFGMACVATDIIADRWYDSIVPASLRAAETAARE
jgi:hypothetical protein